MAVEWYEGGETKGKEVECDVIMQLNPELRKPLSSRSVNSRSAATRERSASASSRKKEDRRTICTPAKVGPVYTLPPMLHITLVFLFSSSKTVCQERIQSKHSLVCTASVPFVT